jgi:hypothetical protein
LDRDTLEIIVEGDCEVLVDKVTSGARGTPRAGSEERHPEEENPRRGSGPVGG